MRRGTAIASVFSSVILTVGLWSSVSLAAKDGGKCQDTGAVVVTDSVTYKCTKVEKKLRWVAEQSKAGSLIETATTPPPPEFPFTSFIADVLTIVNKERAESGLGPLSECFTLDQSALAHSQDMNARDFFDHKNPDGKSPSDRIRMTGFYGSAKSRWTGENIAAGFKDAASVMAAWMKSPGHRANILNSKINQLGVGIASTRADSKYRGYIWTQNFGAGGTC
ncbi:MAG: CAP domain-containing protein [Ilumatobacteraceae bacterium]